MRFLRVWTRLPVVPALLATIGLAASGCGKVKDALKEAAGIDELSSEEITALKSAVGWDDVKMEKFKIEKGFKLTDKFPGDLGAELELGPLPLDVPEQGEGQATEKTISYALLAKREFAVGENTITKLEIVSVARYDVTKQVLVIDGDAIGTYLDDADRVKKANNNQEGDYLIVRANGTGGLAYLTGTVTLKKNDASTPIVPGAMVFTTESPFVARSGSTTGKYLLAVLEQDDGAPCKQGGFVSAAKPGIATELSAAGTPGSTQAELPCIGKLDEYKGAVDDKSNKVGKKDEADGLFNKANKVVTDFLGAWKMGAAELVFVQPPTPPANPPAPPAAAPTAPTPPNGTTVPTAPTTPPADTVDAPPPADSTIVRGDEADPQHNLGCAFSGVSSTGLANTLIGDPAVFDDYTAAKGWRFFGDVRITNDQANLIFGNAEANNAANPRSIDTEDGYCLLTTGNQLYTGTSAPYYQTKEGKVSEIWQKVKVPAGATGVQIRVAFFSQEYPSFVGTQYNDAFYAMFDESPYFIAEGNLNDLAGINSTDATVVESVQNCKTKTSLPLGQEHKCGEWNNVTFGNIMHGQLWGVQASTEGPALAPTMNCGATGTTNQGKCYPGMIKPRVICRALDSQFEAPGKTLTLRIGVMDVGDSFYDSALAVDSVVFTTAADPCGEMFSGGATRDPESEVTRNPAP